MKAFVILFIITVFAATVSSSLVSSPYQFATLGGGCFWCMEAIFERIPGVVDVESGYAGGHLPHPTYKDVKSGASGYAEVIKIIFDPRNITYEDLINAFFYAHDPTTLNRQGIDVGHQYRSVIYYHDEEQKKAAENVLNFLKTNATFEKEIVTELAPLRNYYPAEDYHQDYFNTFQENQYCTVDTADIAYKIDKFFTKFSQLPRKTAITENPEALVKKPTISPEKIVRSINTFHPWHNISYGSNAPETVKAFIEIQKGSTAKYEVDKLTGYLGLDRVVHPSFPYPVHYGFIPQTLYGDGDGLDILVLSSVRLHAMSLVPVRVIGLISMLDDGEMDDKVLGVVDRDRVFADVNDVKDLAPGVVEELTKYFENYKKPDNGNVTIKGVGGKTVAYKAIEEGIQLYKDVYVSSD